jgi:Tn3 transposase DDE domain
MRRRRNILAVLIALATNLGLARMSEACGISYDVLAWTMEWYVREETLREANTCVVNHHYGPAVASKKNNSSLRLCCSQPYKKRRNPLPGSVSTAV